MAVAVLTQRQFVCVYDNQAEPQAVDCLVSWDIHLKWCQPGKGGILFLFLTRIIQIEISWY